MLFCPTQRRFISMVYNVHVLGRPVVPFYPFLGEGSPTQINYRRKGDLILSSLLEDLVSDKLGVSLPFHCYNVEAVSLQGKTITRPQCSTDFTG